MKTFPTPLLQGEIFEDINFYTPYSIYIQYLIVCTQNIVTGKQLYWVIKHMYLLEIER